MNAPFAKSSEFLEAVALLVDLQFAICEENEDRADALRDALDIPLNKLSWEANEWLRGLSGDLDMLCDQEVFEPNKQSATDFQWNLRTALRNLENDPETVLMLLRKEQKTLPPDAVAYFRGFAYFLLDISQIGMLFIQRAIFLNPENMVYKIGLLSRLWPSSNFDQTRPLAEAILEDKAADHETILLAAGIMLQIIRNTSSNNREVLGKLRRKVEDVIHSISQSRPMPDFAGFGFNLLGMISEALNRTGQAQDYYSRACDLMPGDETPFLLRGRLMLKRDARKALPDFRRAVNLETLDPLPYLVLARESLKVGDYADCQAMCRAVIKIGGFLVQGRAYELMAIAETQMHGETDLALTYFQEAHRLFPSDENIRINLAAFEEARREHLEQKSDRLTDLAEYPLGLQEENETVNNDPLDLMLQTRSRQLWANNSQLTSPMQLGMAA